MHYGHSLVREILIHATNLDYGQCAELQVVCPACHKPLHKRGKLDGSLQYLAHYADRDADCELRVRSIVLAALAAQGRSAYVVNVPTNESLSMFLRQFEEILLDHFPVITQEHFISRLAGRSNLRIMLKFLRRVLRVEGAKYIDGWLRFSPAEIVAMHHVHQYLTAPNMERPLAFAVCLAAVGYWELPNEDAWWKEFSRATLEAITTYDNVSLKRWWQSLNLDQRKNTGVMLMYLMLTGALNFVDAVTQRT